MDSDIICFEGFIGGSSGTLEKYIYSVSAEQLVKQRFTRSSPLVRAFLLLLAQNNPLNLVNGNKVDLGKALSKYNSKEYHHVFPRAYLKKREFPAEKIGSLANFCFLPADSNKKISSKSPSDYFVNVVPQGAFAVILESNLLPLNKEVYEKNDYEKFLTLRSQRLMVFLDKQLV